MFYRFYLVIFALLLVFSCKKTQNYKEIAKVEFSGEYEYLKDIKAEDGGVGFEKIADKLGYETNEPEVYGSPKAQKGGVYHYSYLNFPTTFRQFGEGVDIYSFGATEMLYMTLLNFNSREAKFEPRLATHWKYIPPTEKGDLISGMYFRLDPNARWSDGVPFTADDVIATWKIRQDEGIRDPYTNAHSKKFTIEKISPYIIKVTILDSNARKDWYQANNIAIGFYILPAHYISVVDGKDFMERFDDTILPGTGPYEILPENVKVGEYILRTRKPNWWGANYPRWKNYFNMDFQHDVIVDSNLNREKFKKGELEYYTPTTNEWYGEFGKDTSFDYLKRNLILRKVIIWDTPKGGTTLSFNVRFKPFDNAKVREGIVRLVDKQKLGSFYKGDVLFPESYFSFSKFANPNIQKREYDPILAIKYLDESGYSILDKDGVRKNKDGNRLEFDFFYVKDDSTVAKLSLLQEEFKKYGIKMNLVTVESSVYVDKQWKDALPIFFSTINAARLPLPETLDIFFGSGSLNSPYNICGYDDPVLNDIIFKYKSELDSEKRKKILMDFDLEYNKLNYEFPLYSVAYNARFLHWRYLKFLDDIYSKDGDSVYVWWIDQNEYKKTLEAQKNKDIVFKEEKILYDPFNKKANYTLKY